MKYVKTQLRTQSKNTSRVAMCDCAWGRATGSDNQCVCGIGILDMEVKAAAYQ